MADIAQVVKSEDVEALCKAFQQQIEKRKVTIGSWIAVGVVISSFALFGLFAFIPGVAAKEIVFYVLGTLSAALTTVLTYYFGSSASSMSKNDTIDKVLEKFNQNKYGGH